MASLDSIGDGFRNDSLSLKTRALEIGRNLRACLLSGLGTVFLSALFVSPASASSTCMPGNVSKVLNAGTIVIPANAPSGTVVSTIAPADFQMRCAFLNNTPFNTTVTATLQLSVTAALAPGFADVYKTSVDGLGIRYVFNAPTCNGSNLPLSNSLLRIPCVVSGVIGGQYQDTNVTVTAIFVTYGAVKPGATTLSSVPLLAEAYEMSDNPGKLWPQSLPVYTGSATGTLNTATCSVQTQDVAVYLPTPAVRAFAAGVGAVAGRTAFHLDFTCSTGAQVSIVITDVVTPANRSNVLTLSPESTVTGIGVQVLKGDGTPVVFGPDAVGLGVVNQWLIGASPNGVLVLPMSAQYIRTGAVTPGSVKAMATFTMSYN